MTTTTATAKSNGTATTDNPMVKEYAALVALYPVRSGADKAQVSAKIGRMTLDLLSAGARMRIDGEGDTFTVVDLHGPCEGDQYDFLFWTKPGASVRKSYTTTPLELLNRIDADRSMVSNVALPEVVRSNSEKRLNVDLDAARARGIIDADGAVIVEVSGYSAPETA